MEVPAATVVVMDLRLHSIVLAIVRLHATTVIAWEQRIRETAKKTAVQVVVMDTATVPRTLVDVLLIVAPVVEMSVAMEQRIRETA